MPKISLNVLIEDDALMGKVQKFCIKAGHHATLAGNGMLLDVTKRSLIDATRGDRGFDLLVFNDDVTLTRRLRQIGFKQYIIVITNENWASEKSIEHGADFELEHPITTRQLDAILKDVSMDKRPSQHHHHKPAPIPIVSPEELKKRHEIANAFQAIVFMDTLKIKSLRFLLVDDSAIANKVLSFILTKKSHSVVQANCSDVAFSMIENSVIAQKFGVSFSKYDIVMMTFWMPGLDGPQLAKKMRQAGFTGIILGMIGDQPHPGDVQHFIRMGADRVLTKPVDLASIENTFKEMCFVDGYPHWAQMRDEEEKLCRLAAEKIAKAAKSNGSSANTQSSVVKRRIRVLVVEYSESLRKEWSTLVEGFGHEPIACEIGGEAFAKVRQSQSDLERDPGAEQIDMILLRASARQQLDQIRSYHYRGFIVGVLMDHDEKMTAAEVKAAGMNMAVRAPLTLATMRTIIGDYKKMPLVHATELNNDDDDEHAAMKISAALAMVSISGDDLLVTGKTANRFLTVDRLLSQEFESLATMGLPWRHIPYDAKGPSNAALHGSGSGKSGHGDDDVFTDTHSHKHHEYESPAWEGHRKADKLHNMPSGSGSSSSSSSSSVGLSGISSIGLLDAPCGAGAGAVKKRPLSPTGSIASSVASSTAYSLSSMASRRRAETAALLSRPKIKVVFPTYNPTPKAKPEIDEALWEEMSRPYRITDEKVAKVALVMQLLEKKEMEGFPPPRVVPLPDRAALHKEMADRRERFRSVHNEYIASSDAHIKTYTSSGKRPATSVTNSTITDGSTSSTTITTSSSVNSSNSNSRSGVGGPSARMAGGKAGASSTKGFTRSVSSPLSSTLDSMPMQIQMGLISPLKGHVSPIKSLSTSTSASTSASAIPSTGQNASPATPLPSSCPNPQRRLAPLVGRQVAATKHALLGK